ncbi:hypothetical protein HK102_007141 [Quaeritorhiza haematococci]|nr:hypothetical protein HK102_007141 [Quaeritorhiza haematococci]
MTLTITPSTSPSLTATLPPELLSKTILYLSDARDFCAFTSACRLLRTFFTASNRAYSLLTAYGSDDVFNYWDTIHGSLKDPGRFVPLVMAHTWDKSNIIPPDPNWKFQPAEVVRELVERGADMKMYVWGDSYYYFPLYWAAAMGDVRLVRFCAAKGAVDVGQWALRQAARLGNEEMVRLLRDEIGDGGIKPVFANHNGKRIISDAVYGGNTRIVEFLLDGFEGGASEDEIGCDDLDGLDLVHVAVNRGGIEMVRLLVERGVVELRERREWSGNVLKAAFKKGGVELVEYLLDCGMVDTTGEMHLMLEMRAEMREGDGR